MGTYPRLIIDRNKINYNLKYIKRICNDADIEITAVIKGFSSMPEIVVEILKTGITSIGDSRIDKIKELVKMGIKAEYMLIRIPMITELEEVVEYTSTSVHSELKTLMELNVIAKRQKKIHKVILMVDLGDLREGIFDEKELRHIAEYLITKLHYLKLIGIGTNLGCYGSIKPTVENLNKLVGMKKYVEDELGISLDMVSGGGTSTIPMILNGTIPKGISHLRCGETISCGKSLQDNWGVKKVLLEKDAIFLEAEIIEIKDKPSYPIGEITQDAFGNRPMYKNIGIRKRAIVALGKKDIGDMSNLDPFDKEIEIIGSSSDHMILDITLCNNAYDIGDIMSFHIKYPAMLYATTCDCVKKVFI